MIKKKFTVRNLTADYPFSGDSAKEWFCEVVNSNLPNPIVNHIRNGSANLTFPARCLNASVEVAFQTDDEKEDVEQYEAAVRSTPVKSFDFVSIVSKTFAYSQNFFRWAFYGVIGLVVAASIMTALSYKFDMAGVFDFWEEWNAAKVAKNAKVVIDEAIEDLSDEFYSLPGVKVIEERENVNFGDLFVKVAEGVYLMEDIILDVEGEPVLATWGDIEDKCESLGGLLPTNPELSLFVTGKILESANTWADYPEWARDGAGAFSDDYAVYSKSNDTKALTDQEAYERTEIWWADNGDALFAGRCILYQSDFVD